MKTLLRTLCGGLIPLLVFLTAIPSWAHVAVNGGSESHTGSTGSASEASFSWTHTPSSTARGVIVFTCNASSATNEATAVTYGGVAMTAVSGGGAADTNAEPGSIKTWFLGTGIPTGGQTIVVTRTNNTNVMYAMASSVTAASDTTTHDAGIVLLQENQNLAEQNVTDGSPGSNSLRYAGAFSGIDSISSLSAGANSGIAENIDLGVVGCSLARETTPGEGSRPVGFSNANNEDTAIVHIAIKENGEGVAGSVGATGCGAAMILLGKGAGC